MRRAVKVMVGLIVVSALTGCVGIGAVNRGAVTSEAQRRGGGVTGALVEEAFAAVEAEVGRPLDTVVSATATLATVVVVVDDGAGPVSYRYGTSGLYGGRGVEGPERVVPADEVPARTFPASAVSAEAFDAAVDRARAAAPEGAWVDSVTVTVTVGAGEAGPRASVVLATRLETVTVDEELR